ECSREAFDPKHRFRPEGARIRRLFASYPRPCARGNSVVVWQGNQWGRAVEFNDLLGKEGIDPKTVLVLRHRPQQREFRKVLPWLAAERPDIDNAYQQQQSL